MRMSFGERLKHAWNVFLNRDPTEHQTIGSGYFYRPDRPRFSRGNERTIITSVYNRIALDAASITIRHVRLDGNNRFVSAVDSDFNGCLNLSANIDQTGRAFMQDVVMSMLDEGSVAIVPVDTTLDITKSNSYDIQSLRTGRIVQWYPDYVRVDVYNDHTGRREEITLPKSKVCIIENPLYQVMNEPNSTLQRLKHKLALLDATDDRQNSDKLNMIIQLPYTIKTETRMAQAEERRKQVEMQLTDSKYGVAYIDGTEKIVQLGHPLENRLIEQIEYLTNQLYAQLGLTPSVFDGTADERIMLNYNNRTIEPIVSAIVDEMHRKFLTKTARTQGQAIVFFRAPFSLVTVDNLAEIADKFTRNEILNSNEVRAILGYKPVDTARAEELLNKNINPVVDPSMMQDPNAAMPPGAPQPGMPGAEGMAPAQEGAAPEAATEGAPDGQNQNPEEAAGTTSLDQLSKEELESYLEKLKAYENELNDLDKQVDEA